MQLPLKVAFGKAENWPRFDSPLSQHGQPIQTMKKLICILASAALLGACEQKTDVVAPASSPAPAEKKVERNTTVVNPPATEKKETTNTIVNPPATTEKKETTTTTSSPSP
jgi:ABC-type uncharacterized transport system auxiliary subunit